MVDLANPLTFISININIEYKIESESFCTSKGKRIKTPGYSYILSKPCRAIITQLIIILNKKINFYTLKYICQPQESLATNKSHIIYQSSQDLIL